LSNKKFRIRCSAIGEIMGASRTKDPLSKTAQSYLQKWMKDEAFGFSIPLDNKFVRKGNEMEPKALEWMGCDKHVTSYENDILTGTPDTIDGETVRDVKCSWDHTTFPMYDTACPNKGYWWQLQGYMILTGCRQASLDYFLFSYEDLSYDHIPMEKRHKRFEIEYDPTAEAKIREKVEQCQAYVDEHWVELGRVELDEF